MLPNLRFIAASVVATVAMMMFGFGLFAAFRLANQSSVVLAHTADVPAPPVFARGPEETEPSPDAPASAASAVPDPPAPTMQAARTMPDVPESASVVPDAPAPVVEAAPAATDAPPASASEVRRAEETVPPASVPAPPPPPDTAAQPATPGSEPDAVAVAPEIARPPDAADAARPEAVEVAPSPVAASPAPAAVAPSTEVAPPEATGSVKPDISHKEATRAPRAAAVPQAKHKKKVAKPVRKPPPVRRAVVRRVAPQSTRPADSFSNWSTVNAQWNRQPTLQATPQTRRP